MLRFAPGLVGFVFFCFWVWAVLDVIATDRMLVRNLDKTLWLFLVIFVLHASTFKSVPSGFIVLLQITTATMMSLAYMAIVGMYASDIIVAVVIWSSTATMMSLAYMAIVGMGLNINTLPVQSVGVGIGVDYAIYIVDRIRHEVVDTGDIDDAVRRAAGAGGRPVVLADPADSTGSGATGDGTAILRGLLEQAPMMLLGRFRGPQEAGFYRLAMSVVNAGSYPGSSLGRVAYPTLSAFWGKGEREGLTAMLRQWTWRQGVLAAACTLLVIPLLPVAIPWVFGVQFGQMVLGAQVMMGAAAIAAL